VLGVRDVNQWTHAPRRLKQRHRKTVWTMLVEEPMSLDQTTPSRPYYAVIFTSLLGPDVEGYGEMADRMEELARPSQPIDQKRRDVAEEVLKDR
jgi:hypothetical protein